MSNPPSRRQVESAVEMSKHSQIDRCDALDEFGRKQGRRFNRCLSIGASDGCRKIRRPGIRASLNTSGDQVKKE